MEFREVVKSRYSCKKYSDRQVEKEKLAAILEAGRLAPTAKNLQEQHVYVFQSEDALRKIDAVTPCRYGAPTVLVVAFDRNNVFTYPGDKGCGTAALNVIIQYFKDHGANNIRLSTKDTNTKAYGPHDSDTDLF